MSAFKHLSTDGLVTMMTEKPTQIVDIRDERSFEMGRIKGAQHLDNTSIQRFIEDGDLDAPLVVCCYHGNSSQSAAAFLSERGFDEVYSLDGGFTQWQLQQPTLVEAG
tara:strand:- start:154 stop:477 length:324 start_codon:yes stop_codon:yes gene_type:complete